MLNAKLFGAIASVALIVAILGRVRVLPRMNLYLLVGHVSVRPFLWQLYVASSCAILALGYVGTDRLARNPASQTIGLISLVLVTIAFADWMVLSFLAGRGYLEGLMAANAIAKISFYAGLLLSVLNIGWALTGIYCGKSKVQ